MSDKGMFDDDDTTTTDAEIVAHDTDDQPSDGGPEVDVDTTALALPSEKEMSDESALTEALVKKEGAYIDTLAGMQKAKEIFAMRADLMTSARTVALGSTNPSDWVLSKDREGRIFAMPTASACDKIADLYGISIENVRPVGTHGQFEPEVIEDDKGYTVRAWCDAFSKTTGRKVYALEASRSSTEQFLGRPGNKNDHRSAVWTLLRTKATRVLSGCGRVPGEVLAQSWEGDPWKKIDDCTKGHGFGTSRDRAATAETPEDVQRERTKLGKEILARVGGDKGAAKKLLKEITAGKGFDGFDSIERMTKDWQVKNAWARLKSHATFGDK